VILILPNTIHFAHCVRSVAATHPSVKLTTNSPGAASGFALGRNQKVRLIEIPRKVLQIKWLRSVKTKNEHKNNVLKDCITNKHQLTQ